MHRPTRCRANGEQLQSGSHVLPTSLNTLRLQLPVTPPLEAHPPTPRPHPCRTSLETCPRPLGTVLGTQTPHLI